ncbi:hypothetical protein [Pseudoalteromonas sp.]|uniref:hypothetical protein n=1 Tax=Pseudoalteromonas sp. TaxID=53249 RepID=UPI0035667242
MATKPANAKQKQWMSDVAEWANDNIDLLYRFAPRQGVQLHHVLGRSAKHNKVAIGHWFIIPVPFELHDVSSNHPLNVTHHKHVFTEKFGKQSEIFDRMVNDMEVCGYETPPFDAWQAIMRTNA